jgi:hypothetical protein
MKKATPLFEKYDRFQAALQVSGPLDAWLSPLTVYTFLHSVAKLDVAESLGECKRMLVARTHRRFFYGMLRCPREYLVSGESCDKTRRFNFFDSIFVQCAWALSPDPGLDCFQNPVHGMSAAQAAKVRSHCERTLLDVHRLLDPDYFAQSVTSEVPDYEKPRGECVWKHKSQGSHDEPYPKHRQDRDRFRTDDRLRGLFDRFMPRHLVEGTTLEERQVLLKEILTLAEGACGWIYQVLRICLAWTCSTVDCERDFSWLQHVLTEKRLSMSDGLVAAYVIARKAPRFLSLVPSGKIKVRKEVDLTEAALLNAKPIDKVFKEINERDAKRLKEAQAENEDGEDPEELSVFGENDQADGIDEIGQPGNSTSGQQNLAAAASLPSISDAKASFNPEPRRSSRVKNIDPRVVVFLQDAKGKRSSSTLVQQATALEDYGSDAEELLSAKPKGSERAEIGNDETREASVADEEEESVSSSLDGSVAAADEDIESSEESPQDGATSDEEDEEPE